MSQSNFNPYGTPYYGYQQPTAGVQAQNSSMRVQPSMPQMQQTMGMMPAGGMLPPQTMGMTPQTTGPQVPGMLPIEQSYIENILRLNKGKLVTVYATFENNREWNAKKFEGIIEAAGRDHVIISDPQSGMRFLIPMVYVDYVTFSEEIEYEYPGFTQPGMLSQFSPR
ncbi:spore coat protein GerQ [Bacillus sp. FJAT-29937]|uniref:spore coat protein GerQ n=1 Tax=Bacillus sp. FJAT-29937 TaxID=1720553 RepID=UPI0009E7F7F3|nr:spore coat protein GerQ [Bacillus sp. FJAT-29937]